MREYNKLCYKQENHNLKVTNKKVNESVFLIHKTMTLIEYYNFDLGQYQIEELIVKWLRIYPHEWIPLAVLEALYEGRIKAVSVEQILNLWHKKGEIILFFNSEFEKLITYNLNLDECDIENFADIFDDKQKILNSEENNSENNLFIQGEIHQNKPVINKLESIINFEPVEDYSNCFHKLKSLIEQDQREWD